jgi:hypothetical protein
MKLIEFEIVSFNTFFQLETKKPIVSRFVKLPRELKQEFTNFLLAFKSLFQQKNLTFDLDITEPTNASIFCDWSIYF